ncbi:hypothetical protein B1218_37690, partial [Pseudomonas ogarae]
MAVTTHSRASSLPHLVFSGRTPGLELDAPHQAIELTGSIRQTPPAGPPPVGDPDSRALPRGYARVGTARYQTACAGIAAAPGAERDDWETLPPLLTAVGVNDQSARPHFVFQNGTYCRFTISHTFT